GKAKGIVVANYSPELEELKKNKSIYFAKQILSKGVLEGIQHHIETIGFRPVRIIFFLKPNNNMKNPWRK
ncbi:MAG: HAD family hydrolase, partial [Bacteroidota bacterium]|nr:HAD family hydrolase [Bacteroidota bacterium]